MSRRRASVRQEVIPLAEPLPPWTAKGIFTDHIIRVKLRESHLWGTPETVEATRAFCSDLWARKHVWLGDKGRESHTRQELLDPVLLRLGFGILAGTDLPSSSKRREPDYLLYPDEQTKSGVFAGAALNPYPAAIALLEAKKVNHPLDAVSKRETPGRFPHQQVRDYLQYATDTTGKPFFNWAILTNGTVWRLYCRNATPDDYFEFNFEKSLGSAEDFAVFVALFSPAAFVVNAEGRCPLDDLRDDALQYQTKLEDDLRVRVFAILENLANGFYARAENRVKEDQLGDLYQNCLILLYRLLFVLYAEGRGLLPVRPYGAGSNRQYRERFSLQRFLPKLRDPVRFFFDDAFTKLYEELLDLFKLINGDEPALNRKCDVPQYNGGLFNSKAHPGLRQWRLGEKTLAEALRGLMFGRVPSRKGESSRFDFGQTIDYAGLEVRQLGSIYEGLLENHLELKDGHLVLVGDKAERKATGTYYTPDYIVHYIVDHTLGPLCQRIEESAKVQKAVRQARKDNSFAKGVLQLKVLDPAMGSGHFLVRATEYLAEKILDHPTTAIPVPEVPPGLSQAAAVRAYWRRRVVERCIFGVDLNPLAVELSKLSLWLTCIATDQPLSFLDHHVRPGNSLIGARLSELASLPRKKTAPTPTLEMWTAPNLQSTASQVLAAMAEIEETESKDIKALKAKEARWTSDVLPRLAPYRMVADLWISTFFGLRLDNSQYAKLAELLVAKEKSRKKTARNVKPLLHACLEAASKLRERHTFFHWELEFPEVFFDTDGRPRKDAGFDAVLGNPPYVRQEALAGLKGYFSRRFDAFDSSADLYAYFMERGVRLLRDGGYFSFIVSSSFLRTTYALPLRRTLKDHAAILRMVDFGGLAVFASAKDTYVCIPLFAKTKQPANVEVVRVPSARVQDIGAYVRDNAYPIPQGRLGEEAWSLMTNDEAAVFAKLCKAGTPLGAYVRHRMFYGIKTGLNAAFVVDGGTRSQLVKADERNSALLKPALSGEDIRRYFAKDSGEHLLVVPAGWTRREIATTKPALVDISERSAWAWLQRERPSIAEHFGQFAQALRKRQDSGDYWWELRPCDYYAYLDRPKIVFPDISKAPRFFLDRSGAYLTNTAYCLGVDDAYLLGILNSCVSWFAISNISIPFGVRAGEYRYRLIYQYMERVPIRVIDTANRADKARHDEIVSLVDRMLRLHKDMQAAWAENDKEAIRREIETTDKQIDALVYELYGLTEDEIAIVEGRGQ